MNSPLTDDREAHRRPDPRTMSCVTPEILNEVEQALVTYFTTERNRNWSWRVIYFKNCMMEESQLSLAIIEAALTHIIDHLDEHPKLIAVMKTAKIGYHGNGMMLDDVGVRMFVIKETRTENATE